MERHTAKVVSELTGAPVRRIQERLERHLTPEQRERVLAQEARWETFERREWECGR